MIYLRKAQERGHASHGWLESWHTFSFADYYDANFMGFSALRVINEDFIDEGQGFGKHPHKDMEILTYVLEGTVEHQDSMGNKEQIQAGEFQIMSAGTGVTHSEYNGNKDRKLHLYQIWIMPDKKGLEPRRFAESVPGYGTVTLGAEKRRTVCVSDSGRTSRLDPGGERHRVD